MWDIKGNPGNQGNSKIPEFNLNHVGYKALIKVIGSLIILTLTHALFLEGRGKENNLN